MQRKLFVDESPPCQREPEQGCNEPHGKEGPVDKHVERAAEKLEEDGEHQLLEVDAATLTEPQHQLHLLEPAAPQLAVRDVELDLQVVREVVEPPAAPVVLQRLLDDGPLAAGVEVDDEALAHAHGGSLHDAVQLRAVELQTPSGGPAGVRSGGVRRRGAGVCSPGPVAAIVVVPHCFASGLEARIAPAQVTGNAAVASPRAHTVGALGPT
mmetsp:Transcript_76417/g.224196  ORF Transcript_76417/g.224196 Transcript_76417/m.224196 type:complete len:211 (-) Transcript_76417:626-1258(-)